MANIDLGLDHPATHGLLAYPELLGHDRRSSRERGVLALVVSDQPYRSCLELFIDLLGMVLILLDSNRSGIKPGALQLWCRV